jgi:hypothetical protein
MGRSVTAATERDSEILAEIYKYCDGKKPPSKISRTEIKLCIENLGIECSNTLQSNIRTVIRNSKKETLDQVMNKEVSINSIYMKLQEKTNKNHRVFEETLHKYILAERERMLTDIKGLPKNGELPDPTNQLLVQLLEMGSFFYNEGNISKEYLNSITKEINSVFKVISSEIDMKLNTAEINRGQNTFNALLATRELTNFQLVLHNNKLVLIDFSEQL